MADDRALASYLMYPKVFSDFAVAQESYGPTEVLPTPTYFYGLPAGEEIRRARAREDPRRPLPGDRRAGRRRGARLLRAQRPAAHRASRIARTAAARAKRPKAEPGNPRMSPRRCPA